MKPSEQNEQIEQTFNLYRDSSGVVEVRSLKIGKYKQTASGYYEASASGAFVEGVRAIAKMEPAGIYATLNIVNPDLLARAVNRVQFPADTTTADVDIARRLWILADMDATRPAGISTTDAQHDYALTRMAVCRDWLRDTHGANTVLADSGNGGHCLLPCDLPNDADALRLVMDVLAGLASRFNDDVIHVDQSVGNAARISKIYGTMARKGDDTPTHPHRYARLLEVPSDLAPLSIGTLEAIAALAAPVQTASTTPATTSASSTGYTGKTLDRFDVPAFLAKHGVVVHHEEEGVDGWHQWALAACPFNPDHTTPDSMVSQQSGTGKLSFHCRHASCRSNKWQTLRAHLEPGWTPYEPNRTLTQRATSAHKARSQPLSSMPEHEPTKEEEAAVYVALNKELATFPLTDSGNGERFAKRNETDLRYCHHWGKWLMWNGTHWKVCESGEALRAAKITVRQINAEAATIPVEADSGDGKPSQKDLLVSWAKKSESKERLTAMLYLAQNEQELSITSDALDTDHWLFNCANGTIDLHTGELRPHNRADLITKCAPVEFDATATCPRWLKFLERVLPDSEMRAYVQRACGYALTGDISEQCIFFLYGSGKNGKSVFTGIMERLLSGYWNKTRAQTIMHKRDQGGIPNDVAALRGLRLCTVSELEEGQRFNEALIKDLSGGDELVARFLHQEFFTFKPTFKLWLYGNHKPDVKGRDDGIWRRIRLIPFDVTISEEERDLSLPETLREELSGILEWALQGCLAWQDKGLCEPAQVNAATLEYRNEMDNIAEFLAERCTSQPDQSEGCSEAGGVLYEGYCAWCKMSGEHACSLRSFGEAILKKGYERKRNSKGNYYQGIRLVVADESEPVGEPQGGGQELFPDVIQTASNMPKMPPSCRVDAQMYSHVGSASVSGLNTLREGDLSGRPYMTIHTLHDEKTEPVNFISPMADMIVAAKAKCAIPAGVKIVLSETPPNSTEDFNMRVVQYAKAYERAFTTGDEGAQSTHYDLLNLCLFAWRQYAEGDHTGR